MFVVWINRYLRNIRRRILCRRESRRIIGDFVLRAEDMEKSIVYEDNIALCANSFNMHVGDTVRYILAPEKPYGILYRCLLPQKIENMLVAGRCISCTRGALAAICLSYVRFTNVFFHFPVRYWTKEISQLTDQPIGTAYQTIAIP